MVYERDKSTASSQEFAPDGCIGCELLESGVHSEFGLLQTSDQHLVTMKEVLQFFVAVLNPIAVELQKPASFRG